MSTLTTRTPSFCHSQRLPSTMPEKKGFMKSLKSHLSMRKSPSTTSASRGLRGGAPDAPPPAYSAEPPAPSDLPAPYQQQRQGSGFELSSDDISSSSDPYAFLSKFDTVFLIDDSGSMTKDTRWEEVKTVLYQVVPVCAQHDDDGIDIFFLNSPARFENVKNAGAVARVFDTVYPAGLTPTGARIGRILDPYMDDYVRRAARSGPRKTGVKPLNLIVITDGAPTDAARSSVQSALVRTARALDVARAPLWQVGVQFFQVGDDPVAARALRELDDDLAGLVRDGGLRDIVDTCTWDAADGGVPVLTSEAVLKTVLGAVVKRFDEQVLYDSR